MSAGAPLGESWMAIFEMWLRWLLALPVSAQAAQPDSEYILEFLYIAVGLDNLAEASRPSGLIVVWIYCCILCCGSLYLLKALLGGCYTFLFS